MWKKEIIRNKSGFLVISEIIVYLYSFIFSFHFWSVVVVVVVILIIVVIADRIIYSKRKEWNDEETEENRKMKEKKSLKQFLKTTQSCKQQIKLYNSGTLEKEYDQIKSLPLPRWWWFYSYTLATNCTVRRNMRNNFLFYLFFKSKRHVDRIEWWEIG